MKTHKNKWIEKILSQALVEFIASTTIVFITFVLTFWLKGEDGINELITAFGKRINTSDSVNIYSIIICTILAVIFFVFYHFFNTKLKNTLKKISKAYMDIIINLYRIISTYLLSFSCLYIIDTKWSEINAQVFSFIWYGIISLFITSGLVIAFEQITSKKERELK